MRLTDTGNAAPPRPARQPSPAQQLRSAALPYATAAADAFTRAVVPGAEPAAHQVTAGEVQGQGPYPGIPGYSALDNWTRVQATGTYSAPDYVTNLLESAGYMAPELPARRLALEGLDMKAAESLTPYGYRVSDQEAQHILGSYAKGYKKPADGPDIADPRERPEVEVKGVRSAPMTVEAYNKLSKDQRAAVDFNTALVEAREKDLASGWMIRIAPDEAKQGQYDAAQKGMFGEDATTGGYAENVTNLLKKVEYSAPGTSLTDFLSLDMAIDTNELKDLKLPKNTSFATPTVTDSSTSGSPRRDAFGGQPKDAFTGAADNDYAKTRSAENLAMIQLDTIRRAGEVLQQRKASWSPAASALQALGMPVSSNEIPFGWGTPETDRSMFSPKDQTKDQNFNKVFETLLNDSSKTKIAESKAFWGQLKQLGYNEKDIDELFNYLDQRTRWMEESGFAIGEGQNNATVIRELAGLGPVNGNAS